MSRYQYAGPGPVPDPESTEIIRPGDVREYDAEPPFGPWELLDGPEAEAPEDPPAGDPPQPPAAPFGLPVTPKEF